MREENQLSIKMLKLDLQREIEGRNLERVKWEKEMNKLKERCDETEKHNDNLKDQLLTMINSFKK